MLAVMPLSACSHCSHSSWSEVSCRVSPHVAEKIRLGCSFPALLFRRDAPADDGRQGVSGQNWSSISKKIPDYSGVNNVKSVRVFVSCRQRWMLYNVCSRQFLCFCRQLQLTAIESRSFRCQGNINFQHKSGLSWVRRQQCALCVEKTDMVTPCGVHAAVVQRSIIWRVLNLTNDHKVACNVRYSVLFSLFYFTGWIELPINSGRCNVIREFDEICRKCCSDIQTKPSKVLAVYLY